MKKMKFKRFLICAIIVLTSIISYNGYVLGASLTPEPNTGNETIAYVTKTDTIAYQDSLMKMINEKNSIKNSLVEEVTAYINKQSPRASESIPVCIVESCLEENIDICFCMAQTENETNYGTTGMGREHRKSMFGVKSRSYSSYDKAIDDYIAILKKSYLGHGKTEQHLMRNYVTHSGYRYASSRSYETNLSNTYHKIDKYTKIRELQKKYNLINV